MTEVELLAATRALDTAASRRPVARRPCPCTCGGWLAADPTDHLDVLRAVVAHNATERHLAWRAQLEETDGRAP